MVLCDVETCLKSDRDAFISLLSKVLVQSRGLKIILVSTEPLSQALRGGIQEKVVEITEALPLEENRRLFEKKVRHKQKIPLTATPIGALGALNCGPLGVANDLQSLLMEMRQSTQWQSLEGLTPHQVCEAAEDFSREQREQHQQLRRQDI